MAENLVSTVGILATSMANCNVVRADENGVVVLPEFPKTVGDITLGGGGYIPGQGIVIGEGNGTTQSDDVIIGSNITTTDAYYEGGNIAIGNKAEVAQGSIAIGSYFTDGGLELTTKATDYNSVAIGSGATASGRGATALGTYAIASWEFSTALGCNTSASKPGATALGSSASSSGRDSTALGSLANASGVYSTALGYNACASGEGSTALGYWTRASGCGATALGNSAVASGRGSVAIGWGAVARDGALVVAGEDSCGDVSACGNEIVLYATNTCQHEYCETTKECTDCACFGCVSYLRVTKEGKLIVNDNEISGLDISEGIVIGEYACSGDSSNDIAIGTYAFASGNDSTALGYRANASGTSSTALGNRVKASGDSSMALGANAKASGDFSTALGVEACATDGAVVITGGASCHGIEGYGNEIVIFSANSCQYEYCETTNENITCECYGSSSYLRVTKEGKLIVNDNEITPTSSMDIGNAIADKVSSVGTVNMTDNNFTLTEVATALNALINILKSKQDPIISA